MRSWKKRWIQELDAKIPALSEEVKNAPIYTSGDVEKEKVQFSLRAWIAENKKRFHALVATCAAAVITLSIALPIALQSTPGTDEPPVYTASVMLLEINPKAVFSVDKTGIVTDVVAMNQDADVIISNETRLQEMEGKTAEKAMETFVDYAAKLGYLNLNETSAVRVTEYENTSASVRASAVGKELERYFKQKGAKIVVVQDTLQGDAFCQRAGVEASENGVDGVVQNVTSMSTLYGEREAENTNEEDLEALYSQFIPLEELQQLIDFLKLFGVDTTELEALLELPKTFAEYTAKMQAYLDKQFNDLQEANRKAYMDARDLLTDDAYQSYQDSIVLEYGSLGAYWEYLENN